MTLVEASKSDLLYRSFFHCLFSLRLLLLNTHLQYMEVIVLTNHDFLCLCAAEFVVFRVLCSSFQWRKDVVRSTVPGGTVSGQHSPGLLWRPLHRLPHRSPLPYLHSTCLVHI